jgi:hypothetical protein
VEHPAAAAAAPHTPRPMTRAAAAFAAPLLSAAPAADHAVGGWWRGAPGPSFDFCSHRPSLLLGQACLCAARLRRRELRLRGSGGPRRLERFLHVLPGFRPCLIRV